MNPHDKAVEHACAACPVEVSAADMRLALVAFLRNFDPTPAMVGRNMANNYAQFGPEFVTFYNPGAFSEMLRQAVRELENNK